MNLKRFLLERIFSRLRIKGALRFLYALEKIGHPSEVAFPMELLPSGVKMHLRGFMTFHTVQINLDWVWPYWIRKQFDPTSRSFIPRAMNLTHVNQTHRNWTAVGSLGGTVEPVVDPSGLLTPWFDGWSIDFWLYRNGRLIAPSRIDGVEQSLRERLPIVVTSFTQEGLHVRMEVWGDTIDGHDVVIERVRLQNLLEETIEGRAYFSIRPYNPEGMSLIRQLFYRDEGVWEVNRTVAVVLTEKPERVNCSDQRLGDVSIMLPEMQECGRLDCEAGMATALSEYALSLAPGAIREYTAVCTTKADKSYESLIRAVKQAPGALGREQMTRRWKDLLGQGMSVVLPDAILEECFDANKAFLHLFDDGDEITPGPLTYHRFWFRDATFMIHALDKLGYTEAARRKLRTYPDRQRKDGYFISQNGEWDSNGQALWTLMESYRLSPDPDFLRKVYGAIRRAVFWIARKRRKTRHADGPERGLLPPGFSAEHFGPNDYYYWDDFWSLAGIRDAIEAARILGEASDQQRFEAIYRDFWRDVNRSLDQVSARLHQRILPASPFRRMDAGAIGSISALYPLRLLRADDERMVNTVRYLRAHSFLDDGFFQNVVHSGVNPYLTAQVAQCYLFGRSREAWPLVYYLLKIATPTYTWPEAVHPRTGGGCMGDGHHGWAAAEMVLLVRNLLLFEEDDTLVLTPILPREWVWEGARIEVARAPTYFGPVDFRIHVRGDEMELNFEPRFRSAPAKLEWHLPFEVETAQADAGSVEVRQNVLLLDPEVRQVAVRTRTHKAVS